MVEKKHKIKKILCIILILLVVLVCVVLIAAALYLKGRQKMTSMKDAVVEAPRELQVASENNGKVVSYKGETYYLNEDITNILCIGVDKEALEEQELVGYGGQADSLFLAVLDGKSGKASIIGLSRDSMVDVDVYDINGGFVETRQQQLCLAYAYGDGLETSCENTVKSVSRLLYGVPIHGYVAIDMGAIGELNDLLGGVEINPDQQDRIYFDFSINREGPIVVNGQEAELFIRFRNTEELESNNDRIRRQKTYLLAFANTVLTKTKEDVTTPIKLYQEVIDDVVTDLSVSDISYLASQAVNCTLSMDNLTVVQGEVQKVGEYAGFYPDAAMLYELILDTYYYQ